MIRIGGGVVTGNVAGVAIGGQRRVLIVHMAGEAGNRGMLARQREFRIAVIERRA